MVFVPSKGVALQTDLVPGFPFLTSTMKVAASATGGWPSLVFLSRRREVARMNVDLGDEGSLFLGVAEPQE